MSGLDRMGSLVLSIDIYALSKFLLITVFAIPALAIWASLASDRFGELDILLVAISIAGAALAFRDFWKLGSLRSKHFGMAFFGIRERTRITSRLSSFTVLTGHSFAAPLN